ncbi:hypothetical protein Lal_00007532 [Lupinus albus]|nr:hypothetical protein Lal_00007532 [Lupinus albus]
MNIQAEKHFFLIVTPSSSTITLLTSIAISSLLTTLPPSSATLARTATRSCSSNKEAFIFCSA